jgi:hypothetical protein
MDLDDFKRPLSYDSVREVRDEFFHNIQAASDSDNSSLFGTCIHGLSQLIIDTDNLANQWGFDTDFASFLMDSVSVFTGEAYAVLRLVYTLCRSSTDAPTLFFRCRVMDLAFSTLETDAPELFAIALDVIARFLQFYEENAELSLPVSSLLETLLNMPLHDATMRNQLGSLFSQFFDIGLSGHTSISCCICYLLFL